ncbi:hypothetical protein POUND7_013369 [Theobroma cacao]
MEKMNHAFEKMKMLVGMEGDDDQQQPALEEGNSFSFMDDFNRQCSLTTKQRFYGFAICLVAGLTCTLLAHIVTCSHGLVVCMLCSCMDVKSLAKLQGAHVLLLDHEVHLVKKIQRKLLDGGDWVRKKKHDLTAFLIGPKRQVSMMLDPVRIYATAIYLASMIIALFCAFYVHNKLLTLLAIILEFGALIWYSLSYIPFARSMVSKIMLACFDTEF